MTTPGVQQPEPRHGAIYKHLRTNNLYLIVGVGVHTETHERLVVYKRLTFDDGSWANPWIRPLWLFHERFEIYPG